MGLRGPKPGTLGERPRVGGRFVPVARTESRPVSPPVSRLVSADAHAKVSPPISPRKPTARKHYGESPTSPRRLKTKERQRQALELRKAGAPYASIAQALGYAGQQGAYEAVMSALRMMLQEPAEEVRRLEAERLDIMLMPLAPLIHNGNLGAIDRALKIMERRARLLGLDAPEKQEHRYPDGVPPVAGWAPVLTDAERVSVVVTILRDAGTLEMLDAARNGHVIEGVAAPVNGNGQAHP